MDETEMARQLEGRERYLRDKERRLPGLVELQRRMASGEQSHDVLLDQMSRRYYPGDKLRVTYEEEWEKVVFEVRVQQVYDDGSFDVDLCEGAGRGGHTDWTIYPIEIENGVVIIERD